MENVREKCKYHQQDMSNEETNMMDLSSGVEGQNSQEVLRYISSVLPSMQHMLGSTHLQGADWACKVYCNMCE